MGATYFVKKSSLDQKMVLDKHCNSWKEENVDTENQWTQSVLAEVIDLSRSKLKCIMVLYSRCTIRQQTKAYSSLNWSRLSLADEYYRADLELILPCQAIHFYHESEMKPIIANQMQPFEEFNILEVAAGLSKAKHHLLHFLTKRTPIIRLRRNLLEKSYFQIHTYHLFQAISNTLINVSLSFISAYSTFVVTDLSICLICPPSCFVTKFVFSIHSFLQM